MGRAVNDREAAPFVLSTSHSDRRRAVLILGIGNMLLCDEGVGVRTIEAMQRMPWPADVELLDGGAAGTGLLDAIMDRRRLIVIDAMDAGAPPGTIRRLTLDELEPAAHLSAHDLGFVETCRCARLLGGEPDEVVIFGVQPETIAPGLELSATLFNLIPSIINRVAAELSS